MYAVIGNFILNIWIISTQSSCDAPRNECNLENKNQVAWNCIDSSSTKKHIQYTVYCYKAKNRVNVFTVHNGEELHSKVSFLHST